MQRAANIWHPFLDGTNRWARLAVWTFWLNLRHISRNLQKHRLQSGHPILQTILSIWTIQLLLKFRPNWYSRKCTLHARNTDKSILHVNVLKVNFQDMDSDTTNREYEYHKEEINDGTTRNHMLPQKASREYKFRRRGIPQVWKSSARFSPAWAASFLKCLPPYPSGMNSLCRDTPKISHNLKSFLLSDLSMLAHLHLQKAFWPFLSPLEQLRKASRQKTSHEKCYTS